MYNRYTPQPDGSYRRNRMPDEPHRPPPQPNHQQPPPIPVHHEKPPASSQGGSILGFLKNLLPKDLDTGDLLIIILLLLMAGDCQEEQNSAILTLAIYLFL